MLDTAGFTLHFWDYAAFIGFFIGLSVIGWLAGRKERAGATEYFLAGKRLPWYVIGGSFIASNISTEHFIGMIGAAVVYGVCVSMSEWANILSFSMLIWLFIPFLLASQVFTIPEFLERRFNPALRQFFAIVTIISNVVAFLAAVLYGGALAIQKLFQVELTRLTDMMPTWILAADTDPTEFQLWFSIIVLGIVAGVWAIYGGLSSVAWTDLFTVFVMVAGGITVTFLGLYSLAGPDGTLVDGVNTMIERNQATVGAWQEAVDTNLPELSGSESAESYNRLSVFQPMTHPTHPWLSMIFSVFSVGLWYNVLNQFMIQRVLGAKNAYHARMGIVFAGFLKVLMPAIVVVPGLIVFAMHPEILLSEPFSAVRPEADKSYVHMLQTLVPIGLRGLFLAALFGAIQSTVNSVLNSTSTVFTLDIYQRWINPKANDRRLVWVGVFSSMGILAIAIVLGGFIDRFGGNLFIYIQTLYAFFAPPFAAVFLLGILWRRINAKGACTAVVIGFIFGLLMKVYCQIDAETLEWLTPQLEWLSMGLISPGPGWIAPEWLAPYSMQAMVNWGFCSVLCVVVSLATAPPPAEKITDQTTFNWSKLNIFDGLGDHWYSSVITWWLIFVACVCALLFLFSGFILTP